MMNQNRTTMQQNHYLVPQQQQQCPMVDIEHHRTANNIEDAEYLFVDAKDRLLDVNNWNKYCPEIGREFHITDAFGKGIGRHARTGDYVRIDQPDGVRAQPTGFDWVVIEAIEYDDYPDLGMESFAMRVRAAADPLKKDVGLTAEEDTTYTFVVERRGAKLYASYHGRNNVAEYPHVSVEEWECLVKALIGVGSMAA